MIGLLNSSDITLFLYEPDDSFSLACSINKDGPYFLDVQDDKNRDVIFKRFKADQSPIIENKFLYLPLQSDRTRVFGYIVINFAGQDITKFNSRQATQYRKEVVGFVFQQYNLIADLTAKENVEVAASLVKDPYIAQDMLELVGLKDKMNNYPGQLSGGQQQRVCIARALVNQVISSELFERSSTKSGIDQDIASTTGACEQLPLAIFIILIICSVLFLFQVVNNQRKK